MGQFLDRFKEYHFNKYVLLDPVLRSQPLQLCLVSILRAVFNETNCIVKHCSAQIHIHNEYNLVSIQFFFISATYDLFAYYFSQK